VRARHVGLGASRHRSAFVAGGVGMLALALCFYQLSLPDVLTGVHGLRGVNGYDDGVYLGTAIRLVYGVLPYRDYVFVHPPGITVLLSPIALLGRVVGTQDALVIARVLTAVVVGLNAALAGLVVRHRGLLAVFTAAIALALFPLALAADHTVLLEPYLVCFCLLGAVTMFDAGSLASRRRVLFAGVAFGFAGSIKVWAIFVVVAAIVVCLPRWRSAVRPLSLGVLLGFGIPSLPFFLAAPNAFIHDVLVSQYQRGTASLVPRGSAVTDALGGGGVLTLGGHLLVILGLTGVSTDVSVSLAVGLIAAIAVVTVVTYTASHATLRRADWFVLLAAALTVAALCLPPEIYLDYAYFSATFLALLFGVCASQLSDLLIRLGARTAGWVADLLRIAGRYVVPAVVVICALAVLPPETSYASSYLSVAFDPAATIESAIPPGACVVSETPTLTIDANRFATTSPGCPGLVDAVGMWLADDARRSQASDAAPPASFSSVWQRYLVRADYVVMSVPYSDYIPWTTAMEEWFSRNYRFVASTTSTYVYRRVRLVSPAPAGLTASASQLVEAGVAAEHVSNLDKAFVDFLAASLKDPHDAYAHFDLGEVYQRRGEEIGAAAEYEAALRIDATFVPALYNFGVLDAPTAPLAAIGYYTRAVRLKPDDAAANFNLGVLLVEHGKVARGDSYLEVAMRIQPALAASLPRGIARPHPSARRR